MDGQVRWVGHTIVLRVLVRLLVEGLVVMLVASGLLLATGMDLLTALPLAFAAAQVAIFARAASAPFVNPLNYRYLEHFIGRQLDFEVTRMNAESVDIDSRLVDAGLSAVATLRNLGDAAGTEVDVYQTPDTLITASIDAEGGGPIFMSRLTDGRTLVTHDALVIPHEELAINLRRRVGSAELLELHREAIQKMSELGLHPSVAGIDIVVDQLRIEQEAFAQLGPALGSFLSIGVRSNPHLLQVRLPEKIMRQRMIQPRRHQASIRPFTATSPTQEIGRRAA